MAIVTGATMTHVFEVPIDLTAAEVIFVTYQQMGKTVVEKTKEDCTITPEDIRVEFSQEDTLAFAENVGVRIYDSKDWVELEQYDHDLLEW